MDEQPQQTVEGSAAPAGPTDANGFGAPSANARSSSLGTSLRGNSPSTSARRRSYVWWRRIWAGIPLLLVLLDPAFNLYFWRIPKVTLAADYGYQFLIDEHRLYEREPAGTIRILAFGSSVAGSFDPYQVQGLLDVAVPSTTVKVNRLMLPGMHASDYRILFNAERAKIQPDIAVVMFNLTDFLFPNSERDVNPTLRYILPPWSALRERHAFMPISRELDLGLSGLSNLYRYRKLVRSSIQDHVRVAVRWMDARRPEGAYGWYPDGYTKQRFGLPVDGTPTLDLDYYVEPEWIRQRGRVVLNFSVAGRVLANRIETESGWKRVHLRMPANSGHVLDVAADSAWNPRAAGISDDVRLLGLRLRQDPPRGALNGNTAPYRYPPFDEGQINEFLRMGSRTGEEFARKWQEAVQSTTTFGERSRLYRDAKLRLCDQPFRVTGEYAEIERLVSDLSLRGTFVILVNTPESPWILNDYQDSPYYRAYLDFFRGMAKHSNVRLYDLRNMLPPEDFNDWQHVNYIGTIKLGPTYADLIRQAISDVKQQKPRNK